jgi:hypothetical protein
MSETRYRVNDHPWNERNHKDLIGHVFLSAPSDTYVTPFETPLVLAFEDLTDDERTAAIEKATESLLTAIVEGAIRFNDELNHDDLQARIDGAFERAEAMQTPWFAGEYVMEVAGDDIRGMASCDAEDAMFPREDVRIIDGIVKVTS